MKVGDLYSSKHYKYLVVGCVPHKNRKHMDVYTIERKKKGRTEVEYYTQEQNFSAPTFKFEGNINE